MINLAKIFHKNWQRFFIFLGSLKEILAVHLDCNLKERKFKFLKISYLSPPNNQKFLPEDFLLILNNQLKKIPKRNKLFLVFEAPFLKSSISSVSFTRDSPHLPLEIEELENIVLNSAWRLYDQERNYISKILKISEIEIVLVFSKIKDPKLEGKKVINPLGFAGKQLSFTFENTYSYWEWWEELKQILEDWGGEVELIAEDHLIFDKVFSLINKRGILVEITDEETRVGYLGAFLKGVEVFDWGRNNLIRALAKKLDFSFSVAQSLEKKYEEGDLSRMAFQKLTKILLPEFKIFFEGIILAIKSLSSLLEKNNLEIYLLGSLNNFSYFLEILKGFSWPKEFSSPPPKISFYSFKNLFQDIDFPSSSEIFSLFTKLPFSFALIFSYLYLGESSYPELNKILKRRIKWLSKVFPKS